MTFANPSDFGEFSNQYANWNGLNTVCITFDIDFAPEYMIENVLKILNQYDCKCTFFATHHSDRLVDAIADNHEIGIHPFLDPKSTQGDTLANIVKSLKTKYNKATGNRFHILKYSYRDLAELGRLGFTYDVSTLRFNCPYLLPAYHADIHLLLLSYLWEDGVCENTELPMKISNINLESPGMKIINFHPMNIYLNGPDSKLRINFLKEHPDLLNCPQKIADNYRCTGDGAETVLKDLLSIMETKKIRGITINELVKSYFEMVINRN